ncbi:MAG: class I SAM-dependent methyltransferase [Candidatus Desantisbacteria bacterium]
MIKKVLDPGSFRDPSGQIYIYDGRIFRTVMPCATADFEYVESSGLIKQLEEEGLIVESKQVDPVVIGENATGTSYVLEHPRIPFISYPYEWSFPAIKAASLMHIDIHLKALNKGCTLSDASAYNMQFIGPNPIFIDRLSFRRYREGEFWLGHNQFCEQFLNPLLLRSLFGVIHNSWYRGTQEGIASEDLVRLLPWSRKISWRILTNLVLPVTFQKKATKEKLTEQAKSYEKQKLPLVMFRHMLENLKEWITGLKPADTGNTTWGDYARTHSYSSKEAECKRQFVSNFIKCVQPKMVWDLGCNTGDYSTTALEAGAENVIGFDYDQKALEIAFSRAKEEKLAYLPLFLDAANPTPDQGWSQIERQGLSARSRADAVLALAFTHHLAIGRNIPLPKLLKWLTDLAPHGVVEFVPKSDPMVQHMLRLREDIFEDYTEKRFLSCIEAVTNIIETEVVSSSGRRLIRYSR